MSKISKRKRARRKRLQQLKKLHEKKTTDLTLKQIQQTTVKPFGNNFTCRYRLFHFTGRAYLLDRFDSHKIVVDITFDHNPLIRQQWNDDFDLYTNEVIDYVIGDMDKEKYWSYEYI